MKIVLAGNPNAGKTTLSERLLLKTGSFAGAAFMAQLALKIKTRSDRYVTEDEPWTDAPEEIYNEAMKQLKK